MQSNPYQAPRSPIFDPPSAPGSEQFLAQAQAVPASAAMGWISSAWALFKAAPMLWIALIIAIVLVSALLQLIPLAGGVLSQVIVPLFVALIGAFADAKRNPSSGHAAPVDRVLAAIAPLLTFSAVYALILVACSVVSLSLIYGPTEGMQILMGAAAQPDLRFWTFLLINLALGLPLYMCLYFAPLLIALHRLPVAEAAKRSFFACLKNIVPFLLYSLIAIALVVVGTIPIGLGLFLVLPVLVLSQYTAYRDLFFAHA